MRLRFLNTEDIGLFSLDKFDEAFFVGGADPVHIPTDDFPDLFHSGASLAAWFFPWQVPLVSDETSFYKSFLKQAAIDYPQTTAEPKLATSAIPGSPTTQSFIFRERLSSNLISPYVTDLPTSLRTQAEDIVKAFFELRQSKLWQTRQNEKSPFVPDPGNTSVLMSYDFHVDPTGQLRLIEINTNASLSLVIDMSHRIQNLKNAFEPNLEFRTDLLNCFEQEFREACGPDRELKTIAIVDEHPETQRLFAEFKLFQELFETRGWKAEFFDPSELKFENGKLVGRGLEIDLVYNRDTDFYFTQPRNEALRLAMEAKAVCLSPHPHEYRLLADKERLLELSDETILQSLDLSSSAKAVIQKALIRTVDLHSMDPELLWKERKKYFFKPKNSHGGKAVYRGSSMSKTTYQHILGRDYLVQEMVPPALLKFKNEPEEFKSDLRFYVYRDRVQLACVRLYRGQMTNAQTPGGGVSVINWT